MHGARGRKRGRPGDVQWWRFRGRPCVGQRAVLPISAAPPPGRAEDCRVDTLQAIWEMLRGRAQGIADILPELFVALIVFCLFLLVARLVAAGVRAGTRRVERRHSLGVVLARLVQWAIGLFGLLVAVTIVFPSFTPGNLIQVLGIGSVAIGFAFRDVLQNFLSGILLLLSEPFRVGDQIVYGSFEGTVEEIQTRATFLRTYDGRRIVIPNARLFTEPVLVNTAFAERRVECDIGIGMGDDIGRARNLMLETLRGLEGVLPEPAPEVLVISLADSSVKLRTRWWTTPPRRKDLLESQDQVLTALKQALQESGIDLPFPTQQILFHDQTEETDGDRARQREGWPARGEDPRPRGVAAGLHRLAEALEQRSPGGGEGEQKDSR
jgi:small conductance mechanosensitive channel